MTSIGGIKQLLKRSRTLRQLHEKLYGAKIQQFARNLEVEKPREIISLAVLVDEKLQEQKAWNDLVSLGVSAHIIVKRSNRLGSEANVDPERFDALTYDYVYDLTGGKKSISSWHIKNVALALANRRYDYIIVSHSYATPPLIGVAQGVGNVFLSSELYLDHCASIAARCGRLARLLPAPAETIEEEPNISLGCTQKFSITPSGLITTKPGRVKEASLRSSINTSSAILDFDRPVIFVITIFMAVGGAERNIIEVMRALRDKYTFVVITTERHSQELGSLHHQVEEFSNEIYDLAELAGQEDFLHLLARLKSAYRPRALLVTNGSPWFLANSESIREIFKDQPIIDHQVYDQKAGWIHHYLNPGIQSFDYYVAINKKIEDVMIRDKNISREKIRQIYHAVNVDRIVEFNRAPVNRETILATYQIPPGKDVYIMIARLTEQKKPLDFLKLVSMRQDIDANEHFVLLGDGPLRAEVDQFILVNRLENITCLPYVDNPVALISTAKAMIFTSFYEGLPVAMLEALSLGVPVFATDVGDIGLILEEYHAGAIFQPNADIQQYNQRFSEFLFDRSNYASRLASNKEAIIERFCPSNIARQYDELLMTGLDKRSSYT
jgi:glycosyltransferase involved in cell wall biosynthesis